MEGISLNTNPINEFVDMQQVQVAGDQVEDEPVSQLLQRVELAPGFQDGVDLLGLHWSASLENEQ